ncbi:MAG: NTP transferase domain-containing protein [Acidimicrobiales bacterium]
MEPTLVIMAAGLGSRFGGVKQLARVGPDGEAIIDFSIMDARKAGFGDVVLIVRSDIADDVKAHIEPRHGGDGIRYALQDGFGPSREKPWGTLHAVLSARDEIDGPFAVINADDYYGPTSFTLAAEALAGLAPGQAANIAFELGNTVPAEGSVTRAVTEVADGVLTGIVETDGCRQTPDGEVMAGDRAVPASTPVSMNFWAFHPSVMDDFMAAWEAFYAAKAEEPKAESLLPTVVGELVDQGRLQVAVVPSSEKWIGITNPDDEASARQALAAR